MRQLHQLKRLFLAAGGLPLIWITLTIVALVPIWHQRLLPHLDTPNHLALIRAWHSYHDPSYQIADSYNLRVRPVPYFLFYFTVHMLMYVVNIEVANKLFLSAYIVLYPLAILSLARALKRSPWLALGGFLLAFNQNWIYGFSSFLMGTTFLFFSLAALLRLLDDGRPRDAWALGIHCLFCYFSHVEAWVCFGIAAISMLVLYRRSWRRGLIASAAMLPSVMFAVAAYFEERHDRSYFHNGDGLGALSGSWRDFPTAILEFPRRVMELFPGTSTATSSSFSRSLCSRSAFDRARRSPKTAPRSVSGCGRCSWSGSWSMCRCRIRSSSRWRGGTSHRACRR